MRLPFISRRRAQANVTLAVAAVWHMVDEADDRTTAALGAQLDAQHDLDSARDALDRERAKRERLKTYMFRTHTGRYEARIGRLLRAVAYEREQAEGYRRTIKHLTDQLLDATGYQGEPLLPAARKALDIDKEDAA